MLRKIIVLTLLQASVCLCQTSVSCTMTGYCGNPQNNTAGPTGAGNVTVYFGISFTVNTASWTVNNVQVLGGSSGSGNIQVGIVCDSNISGSTIGNSSPCPSGNTLCVGTGAFVQSGVATVSVSGCGNLSTSARYWVFITVSSNGITLAAPGTGQVDSYYQVLGAYGDMTAGGTFTGSTTHYSLGIAEGVNIAAGTSTVTGFPVVY